MASRRSLGPDCHRDDGVWGGDRDKPIPTPSTQHHNRFGFRDGRHELSHLCPETSGACPGSGVTADMHWQGVRPGRGALNDRPHLPDALESGWRQPGKSSRTGCRRCHVIQINPMSALSDIPFPLSLETPGGDAVAPFDLCQPSRTERPAMMAMAAKLMRTPAFIICNWVTAPEA